MPVSWAVGKESRVVSAKEQTAPHSVEILYVENQRWLQGWLRRKLGGADDAAADLAHDTFVRVLAAQRAGTLGVLREARAYLTTVAQRLLINQARRQALERAWLETLALLPEPEAPSEEHRALMFETLQRLDAMLDGLPPRVREAFLLVQLDGLPYAEVAKALGVTVRSVKRYMAQAFTQCILLIGE